MKTNRFSVINDKVEKQYNINIERFNKPCMNRERSPRNNSISKEEVVVLIEKLHQI